MEPLTICIASQTPLVQFLGPAARRHVFGAFNRPSDLAGLLEGIDYRYSPGGVTRMVLPLVQRLREVGVLGEVYWISLNPAGPPVVHLPGITLHNLAIGPDRLSRYGATKEVLWGTIHGTMAASESAEMFWSEEFSEYEFFNRRAAERIRALDSEHDFDLFYIHDFQLLPLGGLLGSLKPKILRWHIPFDADAIPTLWKDRLGEYLRSYDAVVVSSRRYRDQLRRFGHPGRVVEMPPYIDPRQYRRPGGVERESLLTRFGIPQGDAVALVVGRMDPMKGQDRAIEAFARIAVERPKLRLVLAGNGSFSSSSGGLGLSKGAAWRAQLEKLATRLGVSDRVTFTGHVTQAELDALYERSLFTLLPSSQEGFGLVVVESWLHHRPAIVSRAAGVADRVTPNRNGILVDPQNVGALAKAIARLADDPSLCRRMGAASSRSVRGCTIDAVAKAEVRLFGRLREV